jgi:hypothetical protein
MSYGDDGLLLCRIEVIVANDACTDCAHKPLFPQAWSVTVRALEPVHGGESVGNVEIAFRNDDAPRYEQVGSTWALNTFRNFCTTNEDGLPENVVKYLRQLRER